MAPLIAALLALGVVLYFFSRESFSAELIDHTQEKRTIARENSSYQQATNHAQPAPYSMGPIPGMATPFRVNQYQAYV